MTDRHITKLYLGELKEEVEINGGIDEETKKNFDHFYNETLNDEKSVEEDPVEGARQRVKAKIEENILMTPEIQRGMRKSTPIRNVVADAPFKVVPTKRGGMGE